MTCFRGQGVIPLLGPPGRNTGVGLLQTRSAVFLQMEIVYTISWRSGHLEGVLCDESAIENGNEIGGIRDSVTCYEGCRSLKYGQIPLLDLQTTLSFAPQVAQARF